MPRAGANIRRTVFRRAHDRCEYCLSQLTFSPDPFVVEHIYPVALGGLTRLDNLALSCSGCNGKKYNHIDAYDIVTGKNVALYHPRRDKWRDHFVWQEDYTQIIGITPTGRATVEKLALNREGVVNLRLALRAFGKHPPSLHTEANRGTNDD